MSRNYPIWHEITNCNYKSSKSYGNRNTGKETIFVGSSKSNSHQHCIIEHKKTKEIINDTEFIFFRTYVNNIKVCESKFSINSKGNADELIFNHSIVEFGNMVGKMM
tara:strand:- start:264 stop:584 length:321 start_codon:yes stop_codon:yes gene_type:complete